MEIILYYTMLYMHQAFCSKCCPILATDLFVGCIGNPFANGSWPWVSSLATSKRTQAWREKPVLERYWLSNLFY